MKGLLPFFVVLSLWGAGPKMITDPAAARAFKNRFAAMADSWADGVEFTDAEQRAMSEGKKWEDLMWRGPDDPLANKVLAAGEPSFDAMAAYYPGKILDRKSVV